MEIYESILYGITRGLTSIFPVDAEMHEFLLSRLMADWRGGDLAGFTALGVALAILFYYRKKFCELARNGGAKFIGLATIVSFALGFVAFWKRNMLLSFPFSIVFVAIMAIAGLVIMQKRKVKMNMRRRYTIIAGAAALFLPGVSILGLMLVFARRPANKKELIRQAMLLTAAQSLGLFAHLFVGANMQGFDYGALLVPSLLAMLIAFIMATLALRALMTLAQKRNLLKACGYYLVATAMVFAVFKLLK